jgi:hypothetical protein
MRSLVVRLRPGEDLRREPLALAARERVPAGWVMTCVRSLQRLSLRLAGAAKHAIFQCAFEIVALTGTLERGGGHLHLAVADERGQTLGGHLAEAASCAPPPRSSWPSIPLDHRAAAETAIAWAHCCLAVHPPRRRGTSPPESIP